MSDRPEDIISDTEVARVHGNANFGDLSPRGVLAVGVQKYAYGYSTGHTMMTILLEHGLIHKPKPGKYSSTLTKRGQAYLRAAVPLNRLPEAEAEIASLRLMLDVASTPLGPDLAAENARLRAALDSIAGIGFDAPATWDWTDEEWERRRADIMQATARAALKGDAP